METITIPKTLNYDDVIENGLNNKSVIIAEDLKGYTQIGVSAFKFCDLLEEIEIPEGVVGIGEWAFGYCRKLKKVTLPQSLEVIEAWAFANCNTLKELEIPDNVVLIDSFVFLGCRELEHIKLPKLLHTLSYSLFSYCECLENVELPQNIVEIGRDCFEKCHKLSTIIFSKTLKRIGIGAFRDCRNLKIEKLPQSIEYIGAVGFNDVAFNGKMIINDEGKIVTYKAMNVDMTCKGFQYEVGKTYEIPAEEKIEICFNGFHSCFHPLHCLNYYDGVYGQDIVLCKCVIDGDKSIGYDRDKIAARKITILKKFDSFADAYDDYLNEIKNGKTQPISKNIR